MSWKSTLLFEQRSSEVYETPDVIDDDIDVPAPSIQAVRFMLPFLLTYAVIHDQNLTILITCRFPAKMGPL
jgi:hypothetical protein